jgi:hypothetical protein
MTSTSSKAQQESVPAAGRYQVDPARSARFLDTAQRTARSRWQSSNHP